MTDIRTISGIPDDLWEDAKTEYDNVSNRIKELIRQDLKSEDDDSSDKVDLLKNSELTTKQVKVARKILTSGQVDKNESQLGQLIAGFYTDQGYRSKCKQALIDCDSFPYHADKGGIESEELQCLKCEASLFVSGLRNNEFECPKCDARLFDV
jgi:hypothetical protein